MKRVIFSGASAVWTIPLLILAASISSRGVAQEGAESTMQLVAEIPGEAKAIMVARDGAIYLVVDGPDGGLFALAGEELNELVAGPVGGAAIGVDASIYYTQGGRVFKASTSGDWQPKDFADVFGQPAGAGRVARTPDGRIWVEGAQRLLEPDGTSAAVPAYPGSSPSPIPATRDLYANYWAIAGTGPQTELLVLAANAPEAWQVVDWPEDGDPAQWSRVQADDNGMVWIGGTGGMRQMDPHKPDAGWKALPGAPVLQLTEPTALSLSPDGLAMAGLVSGQVMEIDLGQESEIHLRFLGEGVGPVSALASDGDGNVWIGAGRGLLRVPPGRGAWQRQWQALGRLPGGNHDIFAAVLDGKLYTSGGATSGWGYPAEQHLFDELWVYDPDTDVWSTVGHMPFHRCYNGIAALAGEIWNVGGAIHEEDNIKARGPRLPLDDVDIYTPATDTWRSGPRLLTARQEPVVVTAHERIYAIGGSDKTDALASVESIGADETAWRDEPPLPTPMRQYAGCVLDGVIYVVGREGAYSFDPQTEQWSPLPPPPQYPQASQIAAHDGEVWVLGTHTTARGYRYSPAEGKWQRAPDLPSPNSWGAAAELDGRLIVAGGAHRARFHFIFDDRMYALREGWDARR